MGAPLESRRARGEAAKLVAAHVLNSSRRAHVLRIEYSAWKLLRVPTIARTDNFMSTWEPVAHWPGPNRGSADVRHCFQICTVPAHGVLKPLFKITLRKTQVRHVFAKRSHF